MTNTETVWAVLVGTGNRQITHTEWARSRYSLNEIVDYYTNGGYDVLVIPGSELTHADRYGV